MIEFKEKFESTLKDINEYGLQPDRKEYFENTALVNEFIYYLTSIKSSALSEFRTQLNKRELAIDKWLSYTESFYEYLNPEVEQ